VAQGACASTSAHVRESKIRGRTWWTHGDIAVYGRNPTTPLETGPDEPRLSRIDANLGRATPTASDRFASRSQGRFDASPEGLANPPFNMSDWAAKTCGRRALEIRMPR